MRKIKKLTTYSRDLQFYDRGIYSLGSVVEGQI